MLHAFETTGVFVSEVAEARVRLPEVAAAFLAARIAEGDYQRLVEAVVAAEAEDIACAEAVRELERLVIIWSRRIFNSGFFPFLICCL